MRLRGRVPEPAYQLRVHHLRSAIEALGRCMLCDHEGPLDIDRMAKRWDELGWLRHIENRLRCTNCGATDGSCGFKVRWPD
jgi:hypothetical protein